MARLKIFAADLARVILLAALVIYIAREFTGSRISTAAFADVKAAVVSACALPSEKVEPGNGSPVQLGDNQMIRRLYGLDPENFDGMVLYYPMTNMNAEELLLVKIKGDTSADIQEAQQEAELAVTARRDTQMHTFEGYAPEQYAALEKAVIDVQGNYILFASGDFAERAKEAFEESIQ